MEQYEARRKDFKRLSRKSKPRLEGLEDRFLLYSTTGGAFAQPDRITFSFVPDGTNIGGTASSLYSTLNSQVPNWQSVFQQAAAIWEQVANVNLVMVADNGAPLGGGSYQQGDPNNGDIRISAIPLASNTLASAFVPPPFNGGPNADDVVINSNQNWNPHGGFDLLTVAIHEFGHALGMGHATAANADMYGYYTSAKPTLSTDDTSGIRSIYGVRQADAWTTIYQNTTITSAADITSQIGTNGQIALTNLDITAPTAASWFKVTVPASTTGSMTVTMQSTNISELSPRVQVYNSSQVSLGYATDAGSYGSTVRLTLTNVVPGQVYYIKAGAASSGATGAGDYALQLNFGSGTQLAIVPPNALIADQPDMGGGTMGNEGHGHNQHDPNAISIGSVTGKGDSLTVRPVVVRQHAHPSGPGSFGHHHKHHP